MIGLIGRRKGRRTIFGKLMLAFTILIVLVLLSFTVVFAAQVRSLVFTEIRSNLTGKGEQVAIRVAPSLIWQADSREATQPNVRTGHVSLIHPDALREQLNTYADLLNVELWIADPKGRIIATSDNGMSWIGHQLTEDTSLAEVWHTHQDGAIGDSLYSFEPHTAALSVILPIRRSDGTGGQYATVGHLVLRVPFQNAIGTVDRIWMLLLTTMLIATVCAVAFAYVLARQISSPLKKIQRTAERFSAGHYQERVQAELSATDEISHLIHAFNTAGEQIERAMEQKGQLEQMRREFLANVSHEFRAPLSSMQGFLELMIDGKIPPAKQSKYLHLMHEDTQLLIRLVKDLLDLSRLEAGQIRLEPQQVDVHELVTQAVERVDSRAQEKGITVCATLPDHTCTLWLDKQRMQQVLNNLLENSIRHTDSGGRIEVQVARDERGAVFEVGDSGAGIPPDELPFIWERFYKVDKARTRSVGGTGLGLAIVKQLITLHGGEVAAESEMGVGTRIKIFLPAQHLPSS